MIRTAKQVVMVMPREGEAISGNSEEIASFVLKVETGQLKLAELRRRAEKKLGAKFDLREFHDRILLNGPMPLQVLEDTIDKQFTQR